MTKYIKFILLSGPTASGKTKLALRLAKDFGGEIISADSRQVYQGMDIVTGKDISSDSKFHRHPELDSGSHLGFPKRFRNKFGMTEYNLGYYLLQNIPVYGLDLVKPDQNFDVSDFVKISRFLISYIAKKGKLPIIVGGTAFWLKNLLSPAETIGISTNPKLRKKLDSLSVLELQNRLKKINPKKFASMNHSDKNNPRRLIRAIEVSRHPEQSEESKTCKNSKIDFSRSFRMTDFLWLSLSPDINILSQKIETRVGKRLKKGAVEETQYLLSKYSQNLPSMSAIGYREIKKYLDKKITLSELKKLWTLHEIQYAKRQLTFLSKLPQIHNFDLQVKDSYDKIKAEIEKFNKKT